jgi:hypothetical protein
MSAVKYEVWSAHGGPRPDSKEPPAPAEDVHEFTRTSKGVAEQDVGIIQTMFHRKAWVREVKS